MSLNISKGNMYPWVTHTWNPIKGRCSHDCVYCYMKRDSCPLRPVRLDEAELQTNLGRDNFIFVGSSTDVFAADIPDTWIKRVLEYCGKFKNQYLFQTKNPERFNGLTFPEKSILACTIETNRQTPVSKAPPVRERAWFMGSYAATIMISIEPVLDFDADEFVELLMMIRPYFVSIGADSKRHNLPEPSPEKVEELITRLRLHTNVIIKDNLKRLRQEVPEVK
jgi:DNA repair photolyase